MDDRPCRGPLCAALLLIASPFPALAQSARSSPAATLSAESFRSPARAAGVHAWWHWLDGAITREGITRDLEGFKAQGVVQATILDVGLFGGRDFGVPRVPFASPEWFAMYRWALAEASRLGITIGVHNCDGWSSSGGPWITPEQSMKQLVWTKTLSRRRRRRRAAAAARGDRGAATATSPWSRTAPRSGRARTARPAPGCSATASRKTPARWSTAARSAACASSAATAWS